MKTIRSGPTVLRTPSALLVLVPVLVLACGRHGGPGRVPEVDPVAQQACEAACVRLATGECVSTCKSACADADLTGRGVHAASYFTTNLVQVDCYWHGLNFWIVDDPDGGTPSK